MIFKGHRMVGALCKLFIKCMWKNVKLCICLDLNIEGQNLCTALFSALSQQVALPSTWNHQCARSPHLT